MSEAPSPTPIRRDFDPSQHITRVNGGEYLKVEHRLAWLRAEHPDAELVTEMVEWSAGHAIFRAVVSLPSGGRATGYGSETAEDFRDYIEKAETKAVGRALAALGFGTQFATDAEDGAPRRPVDAPGRRGGGPVLLTPKQQRYIEQLAHDLGMDLDELDQLAKRNVGVPYRELPTAAASSLIEHLKSRLPT